MNLYSGLPYWIIKNSLDNYFNPLLNNYSAEVAIIGTGIAGALVAHELCEAGIDCMMIDKRNISTGSSIASTALLQYEVDTPLYRLAEIHDERTAVRVYKTCLQAISDIEQVFRSIEFDPDFERVPSVYYASNYHGLHMLKEEYQIRRKYGLPVTLLKRKELLAKYDIESPGALENTVSAQMDTYKGAIGLIQYHIRKHNLKVFSHTEVVKCEEREDGYDLLAPNGCRVRCKYVVVATGFEAGKFLPEKVMDLTSTYAIVSQPLEEKYLWPAHSLIWETKDPHLCIRTAGGNRVMVSGEDEDFDDPIRRDKLLKKKVEVLEHKFRKIFPNIPFKTDMAWCGTFASTYDGLPFIGSWPDKDRMLFALGYGGNGIPYSMIAAQMIKNRVQGVPDDRDAIYGFDRLGKQE